jgi:hypothetical protein
MEAMTMAQRASSATKQAVQVEYAAMEAQSSLYAQARVVGASLAQMDKRGKVRSRDLSYWSRVASAVAREMFAAYSREMNKWVGVVWGAR